MPKMTLGIREFRGGGGGGGMGVFCSIFFVQDCRLLLVDFYCMQILLLLLLFHRNVVALFA